MDRLITAAAVAAALHGGVLPRLTEAAWPTAVPLVAAYAPQPLHLPFGEAVPRETPHGWIVAR